jgi:hypothetical protein
MSTRWGDLRTLRPCTFRRRQGSRARKPSVSSCSRYSAVPPHSPT